MSEYDSEKKDLYWQIAGLKHELKQYKDIEEELDIDLITLFKLLNEDWYGVDKLTKKIYRMPYFCTRITFSNDIKPNPFIECCSNEYDFKDYGKTWALKKEELLNGR